MKNIIKEWIVKAEGDFATASREFSVSKDPNYDAVCFHSQQCVEKYLKALLMDKEQKPSRIHDLAELSRVLTSVYPEWNWPIEDFHLLSRAAVIFRYPGEIADIEEAGAAYEICKRLRSELRKNLGIKE